MKTEKQLNNKGYTLVELVVTILITGMIVTIIAVFISASRTSYEEINKEAVLQQEAQMAGSYIGDIAIEASECSTDSFTVGSITYKVLCIKAPDPEYTTGTLYDYYFIILWEPDTQVLRFCKVKDDAVLQGDGTYSIPEGVIFFPSTTKLDYKAMLYDDGGLKINGQKIYGNNRALLARYVTGMNVEFIDIAKDKKLTKITFHLRYHDRDYILTKNIAGRNLN
jgi:prepilin-type N-terminal cleavage/methylation domain-containing protein